jgi:hypothetical protein
MTTRMETVPLALRGDSIAPLFCFEEREPSIFFQLSKQFGLASRLFRLVAENTARKRCVKQDLAA